MIALVSLCLCVNDQNTTERISFQFVIFEPHPLTRTRHYHHRWIVSKSVLAGTHRFADGDERLGLRKIIIGEWRTQWDARGGLD